VVNATTWAALATGKKSGTHFSGVWWNPGRTGRGQKK